MSAENQSIGNTTQTTNTKEPVQQPLIGEPITCTKSDVRKHLYLNKFKRLEKGFECTKCGAVKKDIYGADDHMMRCWKICEFYNNEEKK